MYLLGYIPADNRVYLSDKDLNIVSFSLLLAVLEYQTAVMRKDFDTADRVLPTIPRDQCSRVAHFLEKQGFKQQAMAVTNDPEHKFDLALQLGDLRVAYQIAKETEVVFTYKLMIEICKHSNFVYLYRVSKNGNYCPRWPLKNANSIWLKTVCLELMILEVNYFWVFIFFSIMIDLKWKYI